MRRDLLPYFGLPFYRAMIERSGFEDDIAAFDEAAGRATPRRCRRRSPTTSSRLLTAVGDEDDVRAGVERYRDAGATSPVRRPDPPHGLRGHAARRRALGPLSSDRS